jgi:hypothetical protein
MITKTLYFIATIITTIIFFGHIVPEMWNGLNNIITIWGTK